MLQGVVVRWGLAAVAGLLLVQPAAPTEAATGARSAVGTDDAAVATVKVGARPADLALDAIGGRLYVLDVDSGSVTVMDTATNVVTGSFPVPVAAFDLVLDATRGVIYVVSGGHSEGPGVVTTVDTATQRAVASAVLPGEAASPVLDARRGRLYVPVTDPDSGEGAVAIVAVPSTRVLKVMRVGNAPWAVALDASGKRLYVGSEQPARISVIDTVASRVVARISVRTSPQYLLVDSARQPRLRGAVGRPDGDRHAAQPRGCRGPPGHLGRRRTAGARLACGAHLRRRR